MDRKDLGMDETEMEDNAQTVSLTDEEGRSLLCYVERSLNVQNQEYALLLPVDAPIEIFAWAVDEEEEEEMLMDIDEEELEDIFTTARAVLAEQDLILHRTALTLTASGDLPEVEEDDIISLDIEQENGQPNLEQFQQLASFFFEEQEYVVCTPLDPLLFFARLDEGRPELLSPEEFQNLLDLEEFQEIRAQLEQQNELDDDIE
ncbi:DUF3727 domain-containing protein [Thermocoleostomius sinensis]|jgi:hypothetical protein|uniref:DUF3727 domain-containing protein n=1 Tax=Thermocoleostomius sinensis A174 TaxID=2016057 RepID=A0A9E8ZFG2_9CYAN|nr:DUF3727 domain-containing protein [Thermocoleostomius sinensis]WAL62077.1 DUF3727 domain-containing protein [Thermocoleostomius sinensis A174]